MHVYIFKYQKSGPYDFYSKSESIRIRESEEQTLILVSALLKCCPLPLLFNSVVKLNYCYDTFLRFLFSLFFWVSFSFSELVSHSSQL